MTNSTKRFKSQMKIPDVRVCTYVVLQPSGLVKDCLTQPLVDHPVAHLHSHVTTLLRPVDVSSDGLEVGTHWGYKRHKYIYKQN